MVYGITLTRKALNKGLKKKRPMRNLNKVNIYKGPKGGPIVRKSLLSSSEMAKKGGPITRRSLLSMFEMAKKGGPVKTKNIKLKKK